ncbi:efflux RND transporter periplasmic adaptor subunit [Bailinhaonella thermotolerans]|uniref:Peptidoglycan binding-like domain-containing protein n=1 Tax=Bailinhaonella thermotolerans TaxID=1070861 RepID=A0A3A4B426_9ACTN|nr:peptidoglycan-binding protein [Bailinhaonella thermotolerans]RJL33067.1 hypothetical protein D5H75_09400 [Bailinhaonella thermotolerans]
MVGVLVVAVVAAVAGAGVARLGPGTPREAGPGSGTAYRPSTAPVERRTLTARTQVPATLGYAGARHVVNRAAGTFTRLPAVGAVIREGRALYRVDGRPVILLYGPVPAYRTLSYGMRGRDVAALNKALGRLGYAEDPVSKSRYFGLGTRYALKRLQDATGLPETGELPLGQAAFLPSALRVTSVAAVPGAPAQPGQKVLAGTSTTPVVTVDLPASQQTEVRRGDRVTITLPDGKTTPGRVTSVGTVATALKPEAAATIPVTVTPARPRALGRLDRAPAQVGIVTGKAENALVVPVTALLAQAGGRYSVEVATARGRHLVPVTPGLFDTAGGLVQVTAPGLSPGQHVVVPAA